MDAEEAIVEGGRPAICLAPGFQITLETIWKRLLFCWYKESLKCCMKTRLIRTFLAYGWEWKGGAYEC